jgi:hypothetical protein
VLGWKEIAWRAGAASAKINVIGDQMTRVASQSNGSLGISAIVGLLIAL